MSRIILRVRPLDSLDAIDLDDLRRRLRLVAAYHPEIRDSRHLDAPYVSVTLDIPNVDDATLDRLRDVFGTVDGAVVQVWLGPNDVVNLERLTVEEATGRNPPA